MTEKPSTGGGWVEPMSFETLPTGTLLNAILNDLVLHNETRRKTLQSLNKVIAKEVAQAKKDGYEAGLKENDTFPSLIGLQVRHDRDRAVAGLAVREFAERLRIEVISTTNSPSIFPTDQSVCEVKYRTVTETAINNLLQQYRGNK